MPYFDANGCILAVFSPGGQLDARVQEMVSLNPHGEAAWEQGGAEGRLRERHRSRQIRRVRGVLRKRAQGVRHTQEDQVRHSL